MSKHDRMPISKNNQDDEIEARLTLLESLIQKKNKEIESYQNQVVDYNRLQEDYMNSQHKLIDLQTEFEKIKLENKNLEKQLKSLNADKICKEQMRTYCKSKHSKLITKSTQTSNEDFQDTGHRLYNGKQSDDKSYLSITTNVIDGNVSHQSNQNSAQNHEVDVASELVRDVTAAASEVAREQYLASMVYEETSGLYYDYKTGYYFDAERSLFYDGNR